MTAQEPGDLFSLCASFCVFMDFVLFWVFIKRFHKKEPGVYCKLCHVGAPHVHH